MTLKVVLGWHRLLTVTDGHPLFKDSEKNPTLFDRSRSMLKKNP